MNDERITAYLLDELPEHEAEQFEEQCFSQPEWPDVELQSAEDDLIHAYIKNQLSPERRRRFEENYLTTAARIEKVLIARSALRIICQQKPTWTERVLAFVKALVFSPRSAVPKFAAILVTLGLGATLLWVSFRTTPRPQTFAHINLEISYDTRAGGSQIQTITVPLAEDALRISLALPQPAPQGTTYRVQWEDVKRPLEDLNIEEQDTNSVSVIIPRDKLTPGQYVLKLFRKNPGGIEERVHGSYLFIASDPVLEASREPAPGESQDDIENLTTLAARKEALDEYLKSARELREANELIKAAHALNQAGRLQLKLNLPDDALGTFKDSLTLTDQVSDPATKAEALNGLAATHLYSGKFLDAIPLAHQAITISEANSYPRGKAEALLILGDCENNTNHTEALKIGNEALTLWQSIGDNIGVIRSHLNIGRYQLAQNSLDDATSSYETARNISQSSGFKTLEAEALINLGFIEYRKGAWQAVTDYLWEAAKLFDAEADPFKMTQITASAAEAYMESGLPEAGVQKYNEALEYIRKAKKPREETIVQWGIGRALLLSGRNADAKQKFEETLERAKSLQDPVVMAMCYDYLGRSQVALGDHASALQSYETSLNLYSDADNPMEVARLRALIGQVHEKSGELAQARDFYQQALQRFDADSDRVNQSATLFALGRLEMKGGNYEIAEKQLRQSIEVTENMRRMSTSRDLTAAFSATVHDRYEQYIQSLMRNHREPESTSRVALAFETSESARARSLAELLRVTDTNLLTNVDPELSKKERSLRQSLRMKEDKRVALLRKKYEKSELEKLDAEQEQLNAEYKNVLATINERYPAFEQLTQPQSWNLRRIQEEVIADDNTLLLEFLLGPDKSYVWAVARNSITSHELPPQSVITDAVKKVYELLREPPKPETKKNLDQASQELAQMILSPVANQLQKQRIIVAADGALNYVPFQILPVMANAEPLVAQHEVINVPSASILGELRKEATRRGTRNKVLAAFGNPVFAGQQQDVQFASSRGFELKSDSGDPATIGRLFYSAREIENLREVASEEQVYTATESDATRDQLLKLDLSQYSILHFATHGLLRPSSPENSGLVLSTIDREGKPVDGFVGLQDIYSLRAPVDLVVLSACQTGLGKDTRGEGLIGLTRGFMYAGATSVVASVWKVEDEATAELMKRFYTEMLKSGKTPSEALRLAQNSIRQEPQWSAPHYWAGFTLQGEYRYVVNVPRGWRTYQIILLSTIVVLALAIGAYFFLRRNSAKQAATSRS